jgi:hypothetical protein
VKRKWWPSVGLVALVAMLGIWISLALLGTSLSTVLSKGRIAVAARRFIEAHAAAAALVVLLVLLGFLLTFAFLGTRKRGVALLAVSLVLALGLGVAVGVRHRAAASTHCPVGVVTASCGEFAASNALPPCQPNDALACSDIDGFPIGRLADCSPFGTGCAQVLLQAQAVLDRHDPSHRPVAREQLFFVDMARVCGPQVCGFSGSHTIMVFTFADGSHRALGVDCPGIAPCRVTSRWGDYAGGGAPVP